MIKRFANEAATEKDAMNAPKTKVEMPIRRSVDEVFRAFIDPQILTQFWLASSSGPLAPDAEVQWQFLVPGARETVHVTVFEAPRRIEFDWSEGVHVAVRFTAHAADVSVVSIEATGFKDVDEAVGATEGFAIVLCDFKTLLETGQPSGLVRDKAALIAGQITANHAEPTIEQRSEQPYVGTRTVIPMSEFPREIPRMIGMVPALLESKGIQPSGRPFLRYHLIDMPDRMDVELGIPVESTHAATGEFTADVLPGGRYAVLTYVGVKNAMAANRRLLEWITESGERVVGHKSPKGEAYGSRYETFLTDGASEAEQDRLKTEVAILLA